jgi:uncharacterized protein
MQIDMNEQEHNQHAGLTFSEQLRIAAYSVHGLTLLRGILAHSAGQSILRLLQQLATMQPDPIATAEAYSDTFNQLALAMYENSTDTVTDAWQAYLIARLIDDRNLWSAQVEDLGREHISTGLRIQAEHDLQTLQRLFNLGARLLWEQTCAAVTPTMPELGNAWIPWHNLQPRRDETNNHARQMLTQTIAASSDWKDLIAPLEHYWSRYGTGPFSHYHVLRWQGTRQQLEGIAHPDEIQLSDLIGQERQQARITTNIERFIAGLPAHDMLLYGPPGTGKSSTVKAIANAYADQGLCLLEINKEHVDDLPLIIAELRGRAPHYLLFIDDLSFEENETSYKKLKVLLEGTSETRPKNVSICATSNRLNLIRENFNERGNPTDDINWRDTMDEKQSLVHRFGLRVTFLSPDQKQYLSIVRELAQKRHIYIAEEDLQSRAMQWERQHAGRSGRSARQFVDDLEAELKYIQPAPGTEVVH